MGSRQRLHLWKCTPAGGLSGPVHIDDEPRLARPVEQAAVGSKWVPGHQILLKKGSNGLHTCLIEDRKKAGKVAMGQEVTAKDRHKWFGERQQLFIKSLQREFRAYSIADEHNNKIDQIIGAKARSGEAYLLLNALQRASMREYLSEDCHFCQPRRGRGSRLLRNLDRYRGISPAIGHVEDIGPDNVDEKRCGKSRARARYALLFSQF